MEKSHTFSSLNEPPVKWLFGRLLTFSGFGGTTYNPHRILTTNPVTRPYHQFFWCHSDFPQMLFFHVNLAIAHLCLERLLSSTRLSCRLQLSSMVASSAQHQRTGALTLEAASMGIPFLVLCVPHHSTKLCRQNSKLPAKGWPVSQWEKRALTKRWTLHESGRIVAPVCSRR